MIITNKHEKLGEKIEEGHQIYQLIHARLIKHNLANESKFNAPFMILGKPLFVVVTVQYDSNQWTTSLQFEKRPNVVQ